MSGGEVQTDFPLGSLLPQISLSGLKGSRVFHPIGLMQLVEELFLLLLRQEARLCRIDVHSFEFLFSESHVVVRDAVVELQG